MSYFEYKNSNCKTNFVLHKKLNKMRLNCCSWPWIFAIIGRSLDDTSTREKEKQKIAIVNFFTYTKKKRLFSDLFVIVENEKKIQLNNFFSSWIVDKHIVSILALSTSYSYRHFQVHSQFMNLRTSTCLPCVWGIHGSENRIKINFNYDSCVN